MSSRVMDFKHDRNIRIERLHALRCKVLHGFKGQPVDACHQLHVFRKQVHDPPVDIGFPPGEFFPFPILIFTFECNAKTGGRLAEACIQYMRSNRTLQSFTVGTYSSPPATPVSPIPCTLHPRDGAHPRQRVRDLLLPDGKWV